jgi:thiol-disulfide isomerase/thioredoxin
MVKYSLVMFTLMACLSGFAQSESKVEISKVDAAGVYTIHYRNTDEKVIPDNAVVYLLFRPYQIRKAKLSKSPDGYSFSVKFPDTLSVALAVIKDKNGIVLDDKAGNGFIMEGPRAGNPLQPSSQHDILQLRFFASRAIGLKVDNETLIKDFEVFYAKHPDLKTDADYFDFLFARLQVFPEETKPMMKAFADEMIEKGDEKSLLLAHIGYLNIKQGQRAEEIKELSIQKFPKGELAKGAFFNEFFDLELKDEALVLEQMEKYKIQFGSLEENQLFMFYAPIIRGAIENKDWAKINKYEALLPDPLFAASNYNNMAWNMSGQDLLHPGRDLDFAKELSERSLSLTKARMANPRETDDTDELQGNFNMYADTYALILYKLGAYEEAYRYQSEIEKQGELDTGGKERYAGMALKVKGAEYTREYLERELTNGTYSKEMLRQLGELYTANNWQIAGFEAIKERSDSIGRENAKKMVLNMLGDDKAIDFTLTDLKGNAVRLSGFKGKTVVIDFWATWCGPCLASFPKMQQLVEKYKGKDVEFLFINTWENAEKKTIQSKVEKLLKEKKYSFNVLYDFEDKVVSQYKVEGIPTKFVISKEGKVIWANGSDDDLDALISLQLSTQK